MILKKEYLSIDSEDIADTQAQDYPFKSPLYRSLQQDMKRFQLKES